MGHRMRPERLGVVIISVFPLVAWELEAIALKSG